MTYLFNDSVDFTGVNKDAFNRLRISSPFTLFDSSHRYRDNGSWDTWTQNGAETAVYNSEGYVDITIPSGTGSPGYHIVRETKKVFPYQPGKSLLVLNTFVFAAGQSGLIQQVGYNTEEGDGILLRKNNSTLSFVKYFNGAETEVTQSSWNIDPMNGSGPSGLTLNSNNVQILWMDFEWLGAGTVRIGFVINGEFIHCHSFHHANIIQSTYMTTATLPIRIEMIGNSLGSEATMKQICSSVISEGGYELYGRSESRGLAVNAPRDLPVANTAYSLISIRLHPFYRDSVAILTGVSFLGITNNATYKWEIRSGGITTGGSWLSQSALSPVQYNITGTTYTGGDIKASGYSISSNQSKLGIDLNSKDLFQYQLERGLSASEGFELSLVITTDTGGADCFGELNWQVVTG